MWRIALLLSLHFSSLAKQTFNGEQPLNGRPLLCCCNFAVHWRPPTEGGRKLRAVLLVLTNVQFLERCAQKDLAAALYGVAMSCRRTPYAITSHPPPRARYRLTRFVAICVSLSARSFSLCSNWACVVMTFRKSIAPSE